MLQPTSTSEMMFPTTRSCIWDIFLAKIIGVKDWRRSYCGMQLRQTNFEGTIHAGVGPKNPASARVLQKAHFTETPNDKDKTGDDDNNSVNWFQQSFPW